MARKRKHPEHVNHERWLVSYADFITLLFAFFVVMFAASNSDQKKAGQIAKAVQVAFQEMGIFSSSGKVIAFDENGGLPNTSVKMIGSTNTAVPSAEIAAKLESNTEVAAIKRQIEQALSQEGASQHVRMTLDSRGLVISLAEAGFFDPGSAVIQGRALPTIEKIAGMMRDLPQYVRVEGHTDNVPINTAQFPSNWELSAARATFVLQYLVEHRVPPARLSAAGYGEYRPAADNTSVEGRALNRRVDIVLLNRVEQAKEPGILGILGGQANGRPGESH